MAGPIEVADVRIVDDSPLALDRSAGDIEAGRLERLPDDPDLDTKHVVREVLGGRTRKAVRTTISAAGDAQLADQVLEEVDRECRPLAFDHDGSWGEKGQAVRDRPAALT
ncbi:hypothetical protein [Nocardioides aromaticivorans]|uniref:hypothetical protein n=1 Tax=Nocardioides aromaticivorans TaxID=200618 RepID=UPI000563D84B|nr:hypothetical protein [Nocardioides aromaticivorans]